MASPEIAGLESKGHRAAVLLHDVRQAGVVLGHLLCGKHRLEARVEHAYVAEGGRRARRFWRSSRRAR